MSKSTLFKRSKSLLGMATKVAAKEVGLKIGQAIKSAQQHDLAKNLVRIQQAHTITKNLAQLKGAAMKAGQLLSIDSSQLLPKEAIEILSQLQSMAEPEKFEIIEKVLKTELGDALNQLDQLDKTPLAAASIGQVHRAYFDNHDLAIKVQYPDIAESIDSDIAILKTITQTLLLPMGKKVDLTETFNELAYVLKLESDYTHEIEMLTFVHDKLKNDSFFYAPKPYPEFSTKKVLAMEFCPGMSLNQWIQSNPSKEQALQVGCGLLDLFLIEFLDWGIVQTDPNYGNYLVQLNPFKVVLLDFGSTLKYDTKFLTEYLQTLYVTKNGTYKNVFEQAVKFNLINPREGEVAQQAFYEMMKISMEPFLSSSQPFVFADIDYEERSKNIIRDFTKALKYSPPPKNVLFLHRKLGGIFSLLRRLDLQIDLTDYWQKLMDTHKKLNTKGARFRNL